MYDLVLQSSSQQSKYKHALGNLREVNSVLSLGSCSTCVLLVRAPSHIWKEKNHSAEATKSSMEQGIYIQSESKTIYNIFSDRDASLTEMIREIIL